MSSGQTFSATPLLPGRARGVALVLDEPLSFWGGVDPATGRVTDAHHPQAGAVVTGRVLVLPCGRGSSSSSSVVAEAIRAGTAPAATVLLRLDDIIVLGALIARELYATTHPVVLLGRRGYDAIASGDVVEVDADAGGATVRVARRQPRTSSASDASR